MQKRRPTNIKCCGKNAENLRARGITLKMSSYTSNGFGNLENNFSLGGNCGGNFSLGGICNIENVVVYLKTFSDIEAKVVQEGIVEEILV